MEEKNYTILDKKKINDLDLTFPDTCPYCHNGINPEVFLDMILKEITIGI